VGSTTYGETFATIVQHNNVAGVQFHPEKSSADGLRLLANYVGLCAGFSASRVGLATPA
jgi:imidazole glycerol-phosphate synthase subunit HisH